MRYIHQISFGPGDHGPAVQIAYHDDDNLRVGGKVALLTTIEIPLTGEYEELGRELMRAAKALLEDGLEDWEDSPPYVPGSRDEQDESEGKGMGHGDES